MVEGLSQVSQALADVYKDTANSVVKLSKKLTVTFDGKLNALVKAALLPIQQADKVKKFVNTFGDWADRLALLLTDPTSRANVEAVAKLANQVETALGAIPQPTFDLLGFKVGLGSGGKSGGGSP